MIKGVMENINIANLNWIAGFLEGEGSFTIVKNTELTGSISVQASQVQREPLERLQRFFGCGNIIMYKHKNALPMHNDYYKWGVYGKNAENIMRLVYALMSPKRQEQITKCLTWCASRPGRNFVKSGRTKWRKCDHPFTPENTYVYPSGNRRNCRTCMKAAQVRYQEKKLNRIASFL